MRSNAILGGALFLVLVMPAAPASSQEGATEVIYRREVYEYQRGGRSDPFRSLLGSVDLGVRFEDLTLRGIVFNADPRESVAVLSEAGSSRRIRARVGQRIGGMTIVGIFPRRIDLVIEEFGVPRRETLFLKAEPAPPTES